MILSTTAFVDEGVIKGIDLRKRNVNKAQLEARFFSKNEGPKVENNRNASCPFRIVLEERFGSLQRKDEE